MSCYSEATLMEMYKQFKKKKQKIEEPSNFLTPASQIQDLEDAFKLNDCQLIESITGSCSKNAQELNE